MKHFKESKEKIKMQSHPVPINIIVWVKTGSVPTLHVPNTMLMTFWVKWVNIYTALWEKVTWKPFDGTWICNFSFVSLNTKNSKPTPGQLCLWDVFFLGLNGADHKWYIYIYVRGVVSLLLDLNMLIFIQDCFHILQHTNSKRFCKM